MAILDHTYHPFFFTPNSLGHQPMTMQYVQYLAPQRSALAATAINCAQTDHGCTMEAMVMFSQ
jgi:hypothetical protein